MYMSCVDCGSVRLVPLTLNKTSIYLNSYLDLNRILLQILLYEFTGNGTKQITVAKYLQKVPLSANLFISFKTL